MNDAGSSAPSATSGFAGSVKGALGVRPSSAAELTRRATWRGMPSGLVRERARGGESAVATPGGDTRADCGGETRVGPEAVGAIVDGTAARWRASRRR